MLRMDPFRVEMPESAEDAAALLAEHGDKAKLCAGGTDVVPNLKHGLHEPEVLVHLGRVRGLSAIEDDQDELVIGSLTTLHEIAESALVREHAPGLALAAAHVAGPQLRRMGTVGGNLCLDTRCLYYNQTYFWREALGFCLKKDGEVCHVVAGGQKCVAAASNDCATMLLCLPTTVELTRKGSTREVALEDFFVAEGRKNTVLEPGELLTRVRIKKGASAEGLTRKEGFAKLRHREAIDYPLLSVGVRFDVDDAGVIQHAQCVVNALAARPKSVKASVVHGAKLDEDQTLKTLAAKAHKQCNPLTNIADDPAWRKDMVPVFVKRAARRARGES